MDCRIKLLEIGIPAHLKGFTLLNEAIAMYTPSMDIAKKGGLYSMLASKHNLTPSVVERRIRHAISHSDDVIPNSHFIAKYKILWEE